MLQTLRYAEKVLNLDNLVFWDSKMKNTLNKLLNTSTKPTLIRARSKLIMPDSKVMRIFLGLGADILKEVARIRLLIKR